MYDRGLLRSHPSPIPVVSVGNITVGGTGKTPFSAHLVGLLREAGHNPAVVMRGYGDDERHLHARMNPGVAVVTGADRIAGIREATAGGADVVVLDDGFQHRRAGRDLDIVLVSAERWRSGLRMLPAGPLREPLRSIHRADIAVITRKIASDGDVSALRSAVEELRGGRDGIAVAELKAGRLVGVANGATMELPALSGASVLAIAGIGDPASFFAQLRFTGARVRERRFRDHHDYTAAEAAVLATESTGHKYVITTEKDAVKLSRVWPANGLELWYLSQAVRLSEGSSLVAAALAKLFKRATSIAG
jgi:tetraacyldisaccharide 4'-kinase